MSGILMLKNNHREPTQICKLFYDNAKLPFLFMLHLHKNFTHRRHFFFGITTKFCNSFKKIPFHWPKLALYTKRLISLIKPVFKYRLCKKTFYKNVYTVKRSIRYAKKKKKRSKVKLYIDDRYWEILQIHLPYCTWYHLQCTQYDKISNYWRSFQNN